MKAGATATPASGAKSTEWHRVVIFNDRLVDVIEKYLRKGSKIYIEGQLQTRKWTDQQGMDRYTTEVVLQRYRGVMTMLDSRNSGGGDFGGGEWAATAVTAPVALSGGGGRRPGRRDPVLSSESSLKTHDPLCGADLSVSGGPFMVIGDGLALFRGAFADTLSDIILSKSDRKP